MAKTVLLFLGSVTKRLALSMSIGLMMLKMSEEMKMCGLGTAATSLLHESMLFCLKHFDMV